MSNAELEKEIGHIHKTILVVLAIMFGIVFVAGWYDHGHDSRLDALEAAKTKEQAK